MSLLSSPFVWVGIGICLLGIIIVVSIIVSKKRSKEVEELNAYFPEEGIDTSGIPVEKVRRATLRREQRRKQQTYIPRQPNPKVLEIEDQEIVDPSLLQDDQDGQGLTRQNTGKNPSVQTQGTGPSFGGQPQTRRPLRSESLLTTQQEASQEEEVEEKPQLAQTLSRSRVLGRRRFTNQTYRRIGNQPLLSQENDTEEGSSPTNLSSRLTRRRRTF